MRTAYRQLTFAAVIVVAPGEADAVVTDEQKAVLDALHLRKIDLTDRVLVVNPGAYVGESTSREIAYAKATGKPVSFTQVPADGTRDPGLDRLGGLLPLDGARRLAGDVQRRPG